MPGSGQHHALTSGRERATLLTLAAVQFTHILDFMIMMPLGAQLMQVFNITPAQFTHLVAAYGFAAALSGMGSVSVECIVSTDVASWMSASRTALMVTS